MMLQRTAMKISLVHRSLALLLVLTLALAGCGGDDDSPPPDDGSSEQINITTAVTLMQLCLESYQMLTDFQNGDTFTLPSPYTLRAQYLTEEHFTGDGLDGEVPIAFIATSGSSIYVVFRGTKTISEWISDATLTQSDYTYVADGGKTETGFTDVYASIRAPILQEVQTLIAGGGYTALYITGHSLGAAVATLAAPDLAANTTLTSPVVYTFASPRVGDPEFALLFDDDGFTTWRVANTYDEVPKLPGAVTIVIGPPPEFRRTTLFYEHVDTEYDVTFGGPIHSIADLEYNHSSCNYYGTLCDQTANPTQCKAAGQGLNECDYTM